MLLGNFRNDQKNIFRFFYIYVCSSVLLSYLLLCCNKIDAPSTLSANNEHYTETVRLQKVIQEKKDKVRNETDLDESHRINTRVTLTEDIPTITANGSLNLPESQQQRRRTNRVHNQRKNTGRII